MSSDTIQLILVTALALVATVAVVVFWQWWREANSAKRRAVLREAARWAVLAAEYLHDRPKAGPDKLAWALAQLRKRFPNLDDAELTKLAERMVANLNASRAADVARLNGKGPRHDG